MEPIHHHGPALALTSLQGFTLIELMVVVGIVAVVLSVVLTSQGTFNQTIILESTAYDVALTIRSAETFGVGSRAAGTYKNAGYGVHFDASTPRSFIMFSDTFPPPADPSLPTSKPGNGVYDSGNDAPPIQTYTLGNGITISYFCAFVVGPGWICSNGAGGLTSLDIVFARPNPDASISINGATPPNGTAACLAITSPQGGSRYITVQSSGEITANAPSCPPSP